MDGSGLWIVSIYDFRIRTSIVLIAAQYSTLLDNYVSEQETSSLFNNVSPW